MQQRGSGIAQKREALSPSLVCGIHEMADSKSMGIEVIKLCRNKPLTDAQRCSIVLLLKDGADVNARYGPGNSTHNP